MTLLGHMDRITPEDLTSMVEKLLAQVQISYRIIIIDIFMIKI